MSKVYDQHEIEAEESINAAVAAEEAAEIAAQIPDPND